MVEKAILGFEGASDSRDYKLIKKLSNAMESFLDKLSINNIYRKKKDLYTSFTCFTK